MKVWGKCQIKLTAIGDFLMHAEVRRCRVHACELSQKLLACGSPPDNPDADSPDYTDKKGGDYGYRRHLKE